MKRILAVVLIAPLALLAVPLPAHAGQLYWVDGTFAAPRLSRANLDGTGAQSLALLPQSLPQGIDFDMTGAKVYGAELAFANAHVEDGSVNLAGVAPLVSGLSSVRGVAVDVPDGKVYWSSTNLVTGPLVQRANLDGSGAQVLLSLGPASGSAPRGLALDRLHGMLYWADFDGGRIQKMPLAGGAATTVLSGLGGPTGIAIDVATGKMYWTETNTGEVRCANLDGTGLATLVPGLVTPNYITLDLDHGRAYWTAIGAGQIQSAKLDGSDLQTFPLAVTQPEGIAYLAVNTTPVLLGSLNAAAGEGFVDVQWSAFLEGPAVFQVLRANRAEGPFVAISPEIDGAGRNEFTYRDRTALPGTEYFYQVGYRSGGSWSYSGAFGALTRAAVFALRPASPNPARGATRLDYEVPSAGTVRLEVFDLSGRLVRTLLNAREEAGPGSVQWDGRSTAGQPLAAGAYFVRLQAGAHVAHQRIMMFPQ